MDFAILETGIFPPNFVKWETNENWARMLCSILKERHPPAEFQLHTKTPFPSKIDVMTLPGCGQCVAITRDSQEIKILMAGVK